MTFDMVLQNCRLIPELSGGWDGGLADIAVSGGFIQAVEKAGSGMQGRNAVDCCGKTLLPGLYDIHQHSDAVTANFMDNWAMDEHELFNRSCLWAKRMMRLGYTTMRCMGARNRLGIHVRNAIQAGVFHGPRLLACGNGITVTSKAPMNDNPQYDGPDSWRRGARSDAAEGADFLKVFVSGSVMGQRGKPGLMVCTREEVAAAAAAGRALGLETAAHCHSADSIEAALDAGVYTIEHGTYANAALRRRIAESGGRHYLVPTIAVMKWCADIAADESPQLAYLAERAGWVIEAAKKNISAAYREGLELGWGTDLDIESLEKDPAQEFRLRQQWCGMSNIDMLRQATVVSAKILHLEGVSGQIKPSYEADMVLFDGKPDEDISAMGQLPKLVVKGGSITAQAD